MNNVAVPMRWFAHQPLRKEITIILVIKIAAIFLIKHMFFGPETKLKPDDTHLERQLLHASDAPTPSHESLKP